ncbi:MAG: hypothetical protein K5770_08055 [Lachnospiraceae bacterium]|nr:hypothetical protein [Lachnospiraceae bacterium]
MNERIKVFKCLTENTIIQVGKKDGDVIDCIVVTDDDIIKLSMELKKQFEYLSVSDDAIRVKTDDKTWSLVVYSKKSLIIQVLDILQNRRYGEIRPWTRGYWLPEGFLIDISDGKVINGDNAIHEYLKAEISSGWDSFKSSLIEYLNDEITRKLDMIKNRKLSEFWVKRIEDDIKLAEYRKENIQKKKPLSGFIIEM